jgi:hypothetical protein
MGKAKKKEPELRLNMTFEQAVKKALNTPGEWVLSGDCIRASKRGFVIAEITKDENTGWISKDEYEANRQLISCVPLTYYAIKETLVNEPEGTPLYERFKAIINRINNQQ